MLVWRISSAGEVLLVVELLIVDGGVDFAAAEEAAVERLLGLLHLLVALELYEDLHGNLRVGRLALPLLVDDHLHHLGVRKKQIFKEKKKKRKKIENNCYIRISGKFAQAPVFVLCFFLTTTKNL